MSFFVSAIVAFGSYFLLLVLFLSYVTTADVKKISSNSKNTVLKLDIVMSPKKSAKPKKIIIKEKKKINTKIAKEIVKKSSSTSAKKKTNLKSLFAKVSTKVRKVVKKTVNTVKKSTTASRFKSKFEKETKRKKVSLSKLTDTKNIASTKATNQKNDKIQDEYLSSVQTILMTKYHEFISYNQLQTSNDPTVKIFFTVDFEGNFGYKIVKESMNDEYNNIIKQFLESLKNYKFPPSLEKQKVKLETIIHYDKENNEN
jgi:hypothetical protein